MVTCFFLFLFITFLSLQNNLVAVDQFLINWLTNTFSYSIPVMEAVTKAGSGEFILIATLGIGIILLLTKLWSHLVFFFALTFGGIALNFILKISFQRERPGEMTVIEVFGYSLEMASYSFPSGHTMRSVLLFSFLIFISYHFLQSFKSKVTMIIIFFLSIATIAMSRVIIGAHFPTDIFAAITISISWFFFCLWMIRLISKGRLQTI